MPAHRTPTRARIYNLSLRNIAGKKNSAKGMDVMVTVR